MSDDARNGYQAEAVTGRCPHCGSPFDTREAEGDEIRSAAIAILRHLRDYYRATGAADRRARSR